jgi:hypothetical protein
MPRVASGRSRNEIIDRDVRLDNDYERVHAQYVRILGCPLWINEDMPPG